MIVQGFLFWNHARPLPICQQHESWRETAFWEMMTGLREPPSNHSDVFASMLFMIPLLPPS